jgi:hypothetical protein
MQAHPHLYPHIGTRKNPLLCHHPFFLCREKMHKNPTMQIENGDFEQKDVRKGRSAYVQAMGM